MAHPNFWARRRLGRRAALRGAGLGAAGLAGAALIGCGGEDTPEPTRTAAPSGTTPSGTATAAATPDTQAAEEAGILSPRVNSTDQAVPGGIIPGDTTSDPTNLDPLSSQSFTANYASLWVYPQLLQFVASPDGSPATGDVEGQLAETYEYAEPTKLVLHLRKDVVWDQRAPTSGRGATAEDVVFSWNKFKEQSISRASLSNEVNESAPVVDMRAIDDYTVEVETAFPYGPLLGALAYTRWLQIQPQEADGGFDARQEMRGAGPWVLENYEPSVRFEYRKNPTYWKPDRPFADGFDAPIISEYAQRLAQFRSGKIYGGVTRQEDVVATKNEFPDLRVLRGEFGRYAWQIYFGLRPDSPFRDERVRRAVSMLIDRKLIVDTFYDAEQFESAGYPVETRWPSVGIAPGYDAFWLNPETDELGAGKAAFEYNPDEAKRLLDAAGHGKISGAFAYISTPQYGTTFPRVGEAFMGLLNASGLFDLTQNNPDYQTDYLPNWYFAKGDFEGIAWGASTIYPHPSLHLLDYYHSQGARQKVAFGGDPSTIDGQAEADAVIDRAVQALDFEEQVELVQQYQRDNAMRAPMLVSPYPGAMPGFGLYWPWVKNLGVYRDYLEQWAQVTYPHWWLDRELMQQMGHA